MKSKILILIGAAALPLGACSTMNDSTPLAAAGTGAAVGAAGGAGVAALTGGNLLAGAAIGAAVGGLAGAVWADRNGDGRADGYTQNGQYYAGEPMAATNTRSCRSVAGTAATGAALGGATGLGIGAVTSAGLLEGAVIGAVVGGIAGAVWADANNDGCVDGYYRDGRYYEGTPVVQPTTYASGERG